MHTVSPNSHPPPPSSTPHPTAIAPRPRNQTTANHPPFPPLTAKSKKARQLAAKTARRLAKLGPTEQPIPLDEQTLDLPYATTAPAAPAPSARHLVSAAGPVRPADGSPEAQAVNKVVEIGEGAREVSPEEADRAREAVRRERRKKSRAGIKERNFLQAM